MQESVHKLQGFHRLLTKNTFPHKCSPPAKILSPPLSSVNTIELLLNFVIIDLLQKYGLFYQNFPKKIQPTGDG